MEDFYTIQGEGSYQGYAAYFLRLGGCDVGCVWCDVKESWPADAHPQVSVKEMAFKAKSSGAPLAVITGGEPAMHDLTSLTEEIKTSGLRTHVETSGAYPLTGSWDWVCLSPKKFKAPDSSVYKAAHELKIIVFNKSDFAWAEQEGRQGFQIVHVIPSARVVKRKGNAPPYYRVCEEAPSMENIPSGS